MYARILKINVVLIQWTESGAVGVPGVDAQLRAEMERVIGRVHVMIRNQPTVETSVEEITTLRRTSLAMMVTVKVWLSLFCFS